MGVLVQLDISGVRVNSGGCSSSIRSLRIQDQKNTALFGGEGSLSGINILFPDVQSIKLALDSFIFHTNHRVMTRPLLLWA
jgi:hypothetical protein